MGVEVGEIGIVVVAVYRTKKIVRVLCVLVRSRLGLDIGGEKLNVRGVGGVVRGGVMVGVVLLLLVVGG